MIELSQEEKKVVQKVVDGMAECDLFYGRYDAKNGSAEFMYGIATVMDYLTCSVSKDYGAEFEKIFMKNMEESEKRLDKLDQV